MLEQETPGSRSPEPIPRPVWSRFLRLLKDGQDFTLVVRAKKGRVVDAKVTEQLLTE